MQNLIWLVLAAAAEVGWISGLNAADSVIDWAATGGCVIASFSLALLAARRLAATTVYILFVGLGTAGTALLDHFAFGMRFDPAALAWLTLLLAAICGLKLTATSSAKATS
jgi:paired small multidrug resistance pump